MSLWAETAEQWRNAAGSGGAGGDAEALRHIGLEVGFYIAEPRNDVCDVLIMCLHIILDLNLAVRTVWECRDCIRPCLRLADG